jgi:glyoxylase-like metal-dependent hydrolase (beta-lactamase superfamily II)
MLTANVVEGVHRVEDAYTNWYLVEGDGGMTVVDAGVPSSWQSFQDALRQLGRRPDDVKAVVLTHGHFDHIGFAERARRELGVPVWVHENDVLLTRKPLQYGHERSPLRYIVTRPKALPVIGSFLRHRAYFPTPVKTVVRYSDGELAVPGRPRVVFTPGHTLGHCALHLPDRDALIVGDACVTFNPYTGEPGPSIVASCANADSQRALRSLDAIAATGARTLLSGHGDPWRDGAESAVEHARRAGIS